MIRSVSTALFCMALICYALPWHGAAVGGKTFGGVSGLHLVTGKTASEKGLFGIETKRRVNVEFPAVLSFFAVLVGAAAGFVKDRKGLVWSAGLNLHATMVLRGAGKIADELAEKKAVCSGCGSANAGNDRFCRNCGVPLA